MRLIRLMEGRIYTDAVTVDGNSASLEVTYKVSCDSDPSKETSDSNAFTELLKDYETEEEAKEACVIAARNWASQTREWNEECEIGVWDECGNHY